MMSTMAFMNVYLLFIILLGFSYINFWVPFSLSLNLFGLADAEFPPEKVELFDKYYNVYLICGLIVLTILLVLFILDILMIAFKKEKNIKLCRIIYFILSPICLITLITNIFVIYGFDKVNNIIKDYSSFKSYYLPLIICIGFLIILFIVMFLVSRNRLKEVKENKS